jgi:hypothetical protein
MIMVIDYGPQLYGIGKDFYLSMPTVQCVSSPDDKVLAWQLGPTNELQRVQESSALPCKTRGSGWGGDSVCVCVCVCVVGIVFITIKGIHNTNYINSHCSGGEFTLHPSSSSRGKQHSDFPQVISPKDFLQVTNCRLVTHGYR